MHLMLMMHLKYVTYNKNFLFANKWDLCELIAWYGQIVRKFNAVAQMEELHKPEPEAMQNALWCPVQPILRRKVIYNDSLVLWLLIV